MNVIKTMKPGQTGANRFLRKYGKQLVAVRYRRKPNDNKTYTTVEIIVDEREYAGKGLSILATHTIAFEEFQLRQQAKQIGAQWSKKHKVWVLLYHQAVELGLIHRQRPDLMAMIDDVVIYG
mgnify:CR=1 FL=1